MYMNGLQCTGLDCNVHEWIAMYRVGLQCIGLDCIIKVILSVSMLNIADQMLMIRCVVVVVVVVVEVVVVVVSPLSGLK